jgi:hypothetical protein
MRASQRVPGTQRIVKRAAETSQGQSDKLPNQKKEPPVWANASAFIAASAAFGFLISCLYVHSITKAFSFPVASYMDFTDFIKLVPTFVTSSMTEFWPTLRGGLIAPVLWTVAILPILQITYNCIAEYSGPSEFAKLRRRFRWFPLFFALFTVAFWAPVIVLLIQLLFATDAAGDKMLEALRHAPALKVFRKGESVPVEGKGFALSSRYILLLSSQDKSVGLIPQAEIQFIERPWSFPGVQPSPSVPHASTSASP